MKLDIAQAGFTEGLTFSLVSDVFTCTCCHELYVLYKLILRAMSFM